MNKPTGIILFVLALLFVNAFSAYADNKVDVVVAGVINHGPMQPTIRSIQEVISKYDDKLNVTWINMETAEGQKYMDEHKLSAHMNILINGQYRYTLNGKQITFQWFESQQWTKDDLDSVISNLLNNTGSAIPETKPSSSNLGFLLQIIIIIIIIAIAAFIIYYKTRNQYKK